MLLLPSWTCRYMELNHCSCHTSICCCCLTNDLITTMFCCWLLTAGLIGTWFCSCRLTFAHIGTCLCWCYLQKYNMWMSAGHCNFNCSDFDGRLSKFIIILRRYDCAVVFTAICARPVYETRGSRIGVRLLLSDLISFLLPPIIFLWYICLHLGLANAFACFIISLGLLLPFRSRSYSSNWFYSSAYSLESSPESRCPCFSSDSMLASSSFVWVDVPVQILLFNLEGFVIYTDMGRPWSIDSLWSQ